MQNNNLIFLRICLRSRLPWWWNPNLSLLSGGKFQRCTIFHSDVTQIGYGDEECTMPTCFACNLQSEVFFKLKGICGESITGSDVIDTDYLMLLGNPCMNCFHFRGFTGLTGIAFHDETQQWILNSYRFEFNGTLKETLLLATTAQVFS